MFLCVCGCESHSTYGGQRTVHRHQASLSATWVLELKLRWASLSASTFTRWATSVYSLNFSSDMYVHAVAHMHMCLLSYVLSLMHTCLFPYLLLFMHAVAHMLAPICALIHAYCGTHAYMLAPICALIRACCGTHAHMLASICALTLSLPSVPGAHQMWSMSIVSSCVCFLVDDKRRRWDGERESKLSLCSSDSILAGCLDFTMRLKIKIKTINLWGFIEIL